MNRQRTGITLRTALVALAANQLGACDSGESTEGINARPLTFEEFKATVPHQTAPDGYVVEGDILMDEAALQTHFNALQSQWSRPATTVAGDLATTHSKLLVNVSNGSGIGPAAIWPSDQAMNLTYCVDTAFGSDRQGVVLAMAGANLAWANVALVNFVHVASQDGNCTTSNGNVVFNVSPKSLTTLNQLAQSFYPNAARSGRQLSLDPKAILAGAGALQGTLTHEMGHILGFRHENNRVGPNVATMNNCGWEDPAWAPETIQDSSSIMNCSGNPSGSLTLKDQTGAACLYGAAPQFVESCTAQGGLIYDSQVQNYGWLPLVLAGDITGTIGQSLRVEAARFLLIGVNPSSPQQICYSAHVQNIGWQPEVCDLQTAGTVGQALRMEAIRIRLVNPPPGCSVVYQAHVQNIGWQSEVSDNQVAGTTGQGLRIEALKVHLSGACNL